MATATVWPATPADVERIVPRLREADRREIESGGHDPLRYLLTSLELSRPVLVVNADSEPACICGVIPESPGIGNVWINSTDLMTHSRAVIRVTRNVVKQLMQGYSLVHAYASCGNQHFFRWAQWAGFTLFPTPAVFQDRPFHHFYQLNPCQQSHQPSR